MLMMRLQRIGRKNSPSYRVLVVDSRQGVKSGKFIDQLGSYDPKAGVYTINGEKAKSWLSKGVQASPTVHNMLVSKGIIDAPKKTVIAPKKEAPVVEAQAEAEVPAEAAEAPAAEETPAA
jgi:small subunit ribosomal protein S16